MPREQRKYLREERAKKDVQQTCFSSEGALQQRPRMVTEMSELDLTKIVFCPFCLCEAKLQAFLVSSKSGISHSRAQCPECENGMLMRTLTKAWVPEEYARWVFEYGRSGFWQKCKYALWKKRLQEKGWTERFWERHKELKAEVTEEDHTESYAEYMNRQGEEAAQEWGESNYA